MKRIVAIIVVLTVGLMISTGIYGAESRIFNIEKAYQYSSTDYNYFLSKLVQKYPNILKSEKIGTSTDGKSIMAVQLGTNLQQENYASKLHILVEAGTHARENINTAVVMNMIEDYCRDYYSDKVYRRLF
jgi:murein tripeptide amidase MpaA